MNGELAQLAALAAHGNASFAGEAAELFPTHSTFRFVNRVRFIGPAEDALGCVAWWRDLKDRGIGRLHMVRMPPVKRFPGISEHHDVAFAGGLAAGILALSDGQPKEVWTGKWQVTEPKHQTQAIWTVDYHGRNATSLTDIPASPHMAEARNALADALKRIRAFAATQELESWTPWFDQALALLASPAPVPPTHPDLLPDRGYQLLARQILAAAVRGWVFGGMGSWNDADLPDPAYESVTRQYFEAVMNGVTAAVNSFESS